MGEQPNAWELLHPRAKVHQFMYYYMGRLYFHPTNFMGVSVL